LNTPQYPDQKFLRKLKNKHKPEEINLNMVTNKEAGRIRARELAKRELIEQWRTPYNPFQKGIGKKWAVREEYRRERILDWRYSQEHIDEMAKRRNTDANTVAMRNAQRLKKQVERLQYPKTADFLDRELEIVKGYSRDARKKMRENKQKWFYNLDKQPFNPEFSTIESEWKYVEDVLPPIQVPMPDMNQTFPTATGWQPPYPEQTAELDYRVRRNKLHVFEITEEERGTEMYDLNFDNRYEDEWDKMMRKRDPSRDVPLTHLDGCEGDIFELREEIVHALTVVTGEPIAARADEPAGRITLTGKLFDPREQYLFSVGF